MEQSSLEHSRRHCLPLNFFLIPFAADTMSPFLYLFGVVELPFVEAEATEDDEADSGPEETASESDEEETS